MNGKSLDSGMPAQALLVATSADDPVPQEPTFTPDHGLQPDAAQVDESRRELKLPPGYLTEIQFREIAPGIRVSELVLPDNKDAMRFTDDETGETKPTSGYYMLISKEQAQAARIPTVFEAGDYAIFCVSEAEIAWADEVDSLIQDRAAKLSLENPSLSENAAYLQAQREADSEYDRLGLLQRSRSARARINLYKELLEAQQGQEDAILARFAEGIQNCPAYGANVSLDAGWTQQASEDIAEDATPREAQGLVSAPAEVDEEGAEPEVRDVGVPEVHNNVITKENVYPINIQGPLTVGNLVITAAESAGSRTLAKIGEDAGNKASEDYAEILPEPLMIKGVEYLAAVVTDGAGGGVKGRECAVTGAKSMLETVRQLASEDRYPREILQQASIRANDSAYEIARGKGGAAAAVVLVPKSAQGEVHVGIVGNCFAARDGVIMTKQEGFWQTDPERGNLWVTPALGANGALVHYSFTMTPGQIITIASDGANDEQRPHSPAILRNILTSEAAEAVAKAAEESADHIAITQFFSQKTAGNP